MIFGIDPGSAESGWAWYDPDNARVVAAGVKSNEEMLTFVGAHLPRKGDTLAIEMMRARGMPMSNEAMDTLVWTGRFLQSWHSPHEVLLVPRLDVKLQICGHARAKDPHVRQAVIDLLGDPGTKANPGATYGVKSHAWAALAVAVCVTLQRNPTVPPEQLFRRAEAA